MDFQWKIRFHCPLPQRVSQITPFINYRNIILQLPRRADLVTIFRNPYTQIFQIPHASRFASTILDIGTQTIVDYHEFCRNNKPLTPLLSPKHIPHQLCWLLHQSVLTPVTLEANPESVAQLPPALGRLVLKQHFALKNTFFSPKRHQL